MQNQTKHENHEATGRSGERGSVMQRKSALIRLGSQMEILNISHAIQISGEHRSIEITG